MHANATAPEGAFFFSEKHLNFDLRIRIGNHIMFAKADVMRNCIESQKKIKKWCSGFRTGNMKGARWMPRHVTAMKDATNQRNASGRRYVAIDPEVSEWGNPICTDHLLIFW